MTISSTTRKAGPFIGNGTTTAFPFAYKVFQASDLLVVRLDTTLNIEHELTLNTDYTVTLNLDQDSNPGGTVNLLAALATGYTLTLTSDLANLQPTDLTNQGGFYPDVINDALDRATIQIQQLQEQTDRSLKVAVSSTADTTLPPPAPNDLIGWDATGNALVNVDPGSLATVVAYATAYCDVFVGNGITTSWTLTRYPGVLYNLDVSINGSTQEPTRDYTLSGTTFTMTTPPPIGARVVVKYKEGLPNYSGDSQDIRFVPSGTGAVSRTVQDKLREYVSVKDFGAVGDGSTDDAAAIQRALNSGAKNVFLDDGNYFLANATMTGLPFNGLTAPSGVRFYGSSKAKLLLDGSGSYAHVLVVGQLATDVTFENITIDGQGAYANGIVMSGLGGGANSNCHAIRCKVIDIHSSRAPSGSGSVTVNQGGAAYIMELNGDGSITDCSAVSCQFGIRYAPATSQRCNYTVTNFYAEDCESILNTTPSNFDNRDYAKTATYNKIMPSQLVMNGVVFKNCGKSTDQMTQFSFIWKDTSAETGGRASGNCHPWCGIAHGSGVVAGTYAGMNWILDTYNAADADWSSAATYSAGNRVKITNNGNLGALFSFGRVGGVTISNVRGWNDAYTGTYPTIGAMFRGIMRGVTISNVAVDVACESMFSFGVSPSTTWDMQPYMISQWVNADNVFNIGYSQYVCDANMPWNGTWNIPYGTIVVDYQFNQQFVNLKNITGRGTGLGIVTTALSTTAPAQVGTSDSQTNLEFMDLTNGTTSKGRFGDYAARISGTANNNFREAIGQTGLVFLTGTGSPEGVRTANVGSFYLRSDGGTSTTLYIKETGTGNTGWVAK